MAKSKIGIVVPYRDRKEHLEKFIPRIVSKLKSDKIDYEIIVVEQLDKKSFNRGKLLNIGVQKAIELGCSYVALHDVDMLPTENVDYSSVDRPTHLATNFISEYGEKRVIFDTYFGGVTLFPIFDYLKINGYSNNYWGWGYEDDDLLFRCKENFIDFDIKQIPITTRNTVGLKFNGHDSVVRIPMPYGLKNYTILISCEPDPINCRENEDIDEYAISSIPGYDTGFSYNSFKRYKFETWTTKKDVISLKSSILEPIKTTLIATVDSYEKMIKFYVNGELVDEETFEGRLLPYHAEEFVLLGQTGNLYNKRRPFRGVIDYFAVWNHALEAGQVKSISDNLWSGLTEVFEGYNNVHTLESCYDMKVGNNKKIWDLSERKLEAEVFHCSRFPIIHTTDFEEIPIPWRRNCTFELLPHKDNGFYENKWVYTETRKNQLRFYNKVLKGKTNWKKDGIDTLKFTLMNEVQQEKEHYLFVEL